jgi:hypothetical protein
MSKTIEFPDALYEELAEVAAADGTTPLGWIAARLRLLRGSRRVDGTANDQTLAERFAGRVGVVASGGTERLAERHSEVFGEMLEAQRKAGRL